MPNLPAKLARMLALPKERFWETPEITVGIVNDLRQLSGFIFDGQARRSMQDWYQRKSDYPGDSTVFIFFRIGHKIIYFIPVSSYVYADSVYWSKFKFDLQNDVDMHDTKIRTLGSYNGRMQHLSLTFKFYIPEVY